MADRAKALLVDDRRDEPRSRAHPPFPPDRAGSYGRLRMPTRPEEASRSTRLGRTWVVSAKGDTPVLLVKYRSFFTSNS